MFCSSRLERVPRGSDLRMSSQDGKGRKEEGLELLANQPACLLPGILMPIWLILPRRREVSTILQCDSNSNGILFLLGSEVPQDEGRIRRN